MRTALVALLLLAPLAAAGGSGLPNIQNGQQSGSSWPGCPDTLPLPASCPGARVAVQPGTVYVLLGVPGDHDIFFYDAQDNMIPNPIFCGADRGIVPEDAAFGVVRIWATLGPMSCVGQQNLAPFSAFVYADGLPRIP